MNDHDDAGDQIKGMDSLLYRQRHSAAHIMAEAVLEVFPEAKYAIGPPIDNGFYYDFDLPRPLTPEDLDDLDKRMRASIKADKAFARSSMSKDEARAFFKDQPYKLELIDGIPDAEVGICKHGAFTDLCGYPHVESTGKVGAFKLTSVAGAYWRGDEKRPMLQRIYGVMFPSEEELAEHLHRLEEAERRDHRRLGKELELFFVDPIAPGSPFFLPKGAIIYNQADGLHAQPVHQVRLPGDHHAAGVFQRPLEALGPLRQLQGRHVLHRGRGSRARREADELPRGTASFSRRKCTRTVSCRCVSPTSGGCTASSAPARCTA